MTMDFLSKLLQGISFVPALVTGIEKLLGGRSGEAKKDAALSFVQAALSMSDAITNRQIVDEAKFKDGLSKVIDGTVECLNAPMWAKQNLPESIALKLIRMAENRFSLSLRSSLPASSSPTP
jgi:hypothetical protein